VSESLAVRLGVGTRELVAIVGAGGKSTLLFSLGDELATAGSRVVLTTTTKLGAEQAASVPAVCRSVDPEVVDRALTGPGPVMVVTGGDDHKVTGPPPTTVDALFTDVALDYVIVEADGARRRAFKAPDEHEPVIPALSTVVVVVMGADAIGGVISEVCHRPVRVAALAGVTVRDRVDPHVCAAVLGHPAGGLKGVPAGARMVVAITKVTPGRAGTAAEIDRLLSGHDRIDRIVRLDHT
jgi:probable selenium-dependent hydroxylase accessory protein YqeC